MPDPCPGKNVEWDKFESWKGYYSDDRNIETLTDTWTIEDCRMACELNKDCKAVKYLQEKSICVLANGALTKNSTGTYQNYPGWDYHYFMCKEGMFIFYTWPYIVTRYPPFPSTGVCLFTSFLVVFR